MSEYPSNGRGICQKRLVQPRKVLTRSFSGQHTGWHQCHLGLCITIYTCYTPSAKRGQHSTLPFLSKLQISRCCLLPNLRLQHACNVLASNTMCEGHEICSGQSNHTAENRATNDQALHQCTLKVSASISAVWHAPIQIMTKERLSNPSMVLRCTTQGVCYAEAGLALSCSYLLECMYLQHNAGHQSCNNYAYHHYPWH